MTPTPACARCGRAMHLSCYYTNEQGQFEPIYGCSFCPPEWRAVDLTPDLEVHETSATESDAPVGGTSSDRAFDGEYIVEFEAITSTARIYRRVRDS